MVLYTVKMGTNVHVLSITGSIDILYCIGIIPVSYKLACMARGETLNLLFSLKTITKKP